MKARAWSNRLRTDLDEKVEWVWRETLMIHRRMPGCRIASSLSPIHMLVSLFYGGFVRLIPGSPKAAKGDRFIASKGHGSIAMYPILSDLGFFPAKELLRAGTDRSPLGVIPDPSVPGIGTINGSLGHGLGVACGMSLALDRKNVAGRVVVLAGDGEMNEGSVWEAIMFAGHHRLSRLVLIVDFNGASMLNLSKRIIDLEPLDDKLQAFGWLARTVPGHDLRAIHGALTRAFTARDARPRVIIANTVKGWGVSEMESNPLSHVASLSAPRIDELLMRDP